MVRRRGNGNQTVEPSPTPPRIKSIRLCDFRGFAGPAEFEVAPNGKHLLVYGENGAGKSSLFHALDDFFSLAGRTAKARLDSQQNKYPKKSPCDCYVEIEFQNSEKGRWDKSSHPAAMNRGIFKSSYTQAVVDAALRKAMFDYRSLLETNFRHANGDINLFEVSVKILLKDYPVSGAPGGGGTLSELWSYLNQELQDHRDVKRRYGSRWDAFKDNMTEGVSKFNEGLRRGLDDLLSVPSGQTRNLVSEILSELGWENLELDGFPRIDGATFIPESHPDKRTLTPGTVTPAIKFFGIEFEFPQNILNEARLSALAIAMYLAGREICTKGIKTDVLRLMVLDDLLIGLDQANRQPVIQMLDKRYSSDWQIILMTHDRVWFEMARQSLNGKGWLAIEMYEDTNPDGYPAPIVLPLDTNQISHNIDTAKNFHAEKKYPSAALHARMALEQALKKVCHAKHIPVPYDKQLRRVSSDTFLNAFKNWLTGKPSETALAPLIRAVELARNVVLNPFSHSTPVTLGDADVKAAIDAVEAFYSGLKTNAIL